MAEATLGGFAGRKPAGGHRKGESSVQGFRSNLVRVVGVIPKRKGIGQVKS